MLNTIEFTRIELVKVQRKKQVYLFFFFQTYVYRNQLKGPTYTHVVVDKFFSASVIVDGVRYASTLR